MSFMDIYGISAVGVCTNKGLRSFMDRGTSDRALQELHDQNLQLLTTFQQFKSVRGHSREWGLRWVEQVGEIWMDETLWYHVNAGWSSSCTCYLWCENQATGVLIHGQMGEHQELTWLNMFPSVVENGCSSLECWMPSAECPAPESFPRHSEIMSMFSEFNFSVLACYAYA